MRPTTDRFSSGIHQRTEVAAFDHDCPGGHGPACAPMEVITDERWVDLDGRAIDDPEHIVFLEQRKEDLNAAR